MDPSEPEREPSLDEWDQGVPPCPELKQGTDIPSYLYVWGRAPSLLDTDPPHFKDNRGDHPTRLEHGLKPSPTYETDLFRIPEILVEHLFEHERQDAGSSKIRNFNCVHILSR